MTGSRRVRTLSKRTSPIVGLLFLLSVITAPLLFSVPSGAQPLPPDFVELIENRTKNSKLFQDQANPGVFHTDVSMAPLHFGSPGSFIDIDNTIVPSTAVVPALGQADFEMVLDDYEWYVDEVFSTGNVFIFRNKSFIDSHVAFLPNDIRWTNDDDAVDIISGPTGPTGTASGNSFHWVDAYGAGRNFTILTSPNRMMKLLQLDAFPPAPSPVITGGLNAALELFFIFTLPTAGPDRPDIFIDGVLWDQSTREATANEVEFRMGTSAIFVFVVPFAVDAVGNVIPSQMVLSRTGPDIAVGVRTNLTYLQNAVYPVVIDPTVDLQVAASADDTDTRTGVWSAVRTGPSCPGIEAGNSCDTSHRWPGVNVPQGSTITAATIENYMIQHGNDGAGTKTVIALEDADNPTAPTSGADFASRVRTTANTSWDDQDFGPDAFRVSPDISSAVQTVVSRVGFASGNAMQVFWDDNNSAANMRYQQRMYDANPIRAAQLHITFTAVPPADEILLTNPTLNPTSGTTVTAFNFTIDYNSTFGTAANVVKVNVSDATNGTFNNFTMTLIGAGPNGTFFQDGTLPIGFYEHFFWANTTGAPDNQTTVFPGPVVTAVPIAEILLTNPTLNPTSGNTATAFNFTIDYNNTLGVAADLMKVNVSDATNGTFNNLTMTIIGAGPNGTFFFDGTLPVGFYQHFFWGNASGALDNRTVDLPGPEVIAIPSEVILTNGMVVPTSGNILTSFNFTVQYNNTLGVPADTVSVNVTDATNMTFFNFTMTRIGAGPNATYFFNTTLSAGDYEHFFWANDTSGFENNTLPFAPGPLVVSIALPAVVTLPASPVLGESARLRGDLTGLGSASQVNVSFQWGDTMSLGNQTPDEVLVATGTFAFDLVGLTTSTEFFFRARANNTGVVFGAILNFTTQTAFVNPNVATVTFSIASPTTVVLVGSLTDFGELDITQVNVSFEWGFSADALIFNTTLQLLLNPTDPFSAILLDLEPGTTIFFRARADFNSTVFGQVLSLTLPFEANVNIIIALFLLIIALFFLAFGYVAEWPIMWAFSGAFFILDALALFQLFPGLIGDIPALVIGVMGGMFAAIGAYLQLLGEI